MLGKREAKEGNGSSYAQILLGRPTGVMLNTFRKPGKLEAGVPIAELKFLLNHAATSGDVRWLPVPIS
jgi:hypothetical protein